MNNKEAVWAEVEKLVNADVMAELKALRQFKDAVQYADLNTVEDLYVADIDASALIGNTVHWTLEKVATAVGCPTWHLGDGMYSLSGDVDVTITDILIKSGVMDEDNHGVARHSDASHEMMEAYRQFIKRQDLEPQFNQFLVAFALRDQEPSLKANGET